MIDAKLHEAPRRLFGYQGEIVIEGDVDAPGFEEFHHLDELSIHQHFADAGQVDAPEFRQSGDHFLEAREGQVGGLLRPVGKLAERALQVTLGRAFDLDRPWRMRPGRKALRQAKGQDVRQVEIRHPDGMGQSGVAQLVAEQLPVPVYECHALNPPFQSPRGQPPARGPRSLRRTRSWGRPRGGSHGPAAAPLPAPASTVPPPGARGRGGGPRAAVVAADAIVGPAARGFPWTGRRAAASRDSTVPYSGAAGRARSPPVGQRRAICTELHTVRRSPAVTAPVHRLPSRYIVANTRNPAPTFQTGLLPSTVTAAAPPAASTATRATRPRASHGTSRPKPTFNRRRFLTITIAPNR